jgi:UV DNA damage endonuclease
MTEIRLGYACINTALRKRKGLPEIYCSRLVRLKSLFALSGPEASAYCQNQALKNIADLLIILDWNELHNIRFFRITSELFPHVGNAHAIKQFPDEPYFKGDIDFAKLSLKMVGDYALKHDHRLTFHSNPYVQLGTPNKIVQNNSQFDINTHYHIFKLMGITPGPYNCLIVHGGGVFDDIQETILRIINTLKSMDPLVRSMLVFENDEWHYNPYDLLPICEKFNLGFCFDIFHNRVSRNPIHVTRKFLKRVIATWKDIPIKMHISQQAPGERRGAHSDIVTRLPSWLATELHVKRLDLMLECKLKEQSVILLQPLLNKPPFKIVK